MSAIALTFRESSTLLASLARRSAAPVFIFAAAFLGYYLSHYLVLGHPLPWCGGEQPIPGCWYQHYTYLTEAMTQGSVDVASAGIPDFYQDTIAIGSQKYVPFSPGPSVLLLPFVAIWGTSFSQVYFSMALGAINVVLFWYLLGLLNVSRTTKLLLVPFFAFGTVHFYAATTGTAWFYGHVAAVFFLLLAIIFLLRRAWPVVPGILLGFAFLSREPTAFAAPFFLYWMLRQRHESILNWRALLDRQSLVQMGIFCAALVPFVAFFAWYNFARFDSVFETGFQTLYNSYTAGNLYSFYRDWYPDAAHFPQFDIRNVPLHLYTIFLMPPAAGDVGHLLGGLKNPIDPFNFHPSPYGMSVLLTSPAFVFAAFAKRNGVLKRASWLAIVLVSAPLLLHFSQGWVQFGYRFLLDFAPFLLILTALGFEDNRTPRTTVLMTFLVAASILVNAWGRYWGTQLGW